MIKETTIIGAIVALICTVATAVFAFMGRKSTNGLTAQMSFRDAILRRLETTEGSLDALRREHAVCLEENRRLSSAVDSLNLRVGLLMRISQRDSLAALKEKHNEVE